MYSSLKCFSPKESSDTKAIPLATLWPHKMPTLLSSARCCGSFTPDGTTSRRDTILCPALPTRVLITQSTYKNTYKCSVVSRLVPRRNSILGKLKFSIEARCVVCDYSEWAKRCFPIADAREFMLLEGGLFSLLFKECEQMRLLFFLLAPWYIHVYLVPDTTCSCPIVGGLLAFAAVDGGSFLLVAVFHFANALHSGTPNKLNNSI